MRKYYFIFDFDGTIVDSFHKCVETFNTLSQEFGFKKILPSEIAELKNLTSGQFIRYLKIPFYKIPKILSRATKEIKNEMLELAPFIGIYEILEQLYRSDINMGIVTSNSEDNVKLWLKLNKMEHFFKFIYSSSNVFGKGIVLKKILKNYNLHKDQVFYIGDETRDIEAAKKNDIRSVSVTWGFNSEKILLESQPNYLIKKPEELLKIVSLEPAVL